MNVRAHARYAVEAESDSAVVARFGALVDRAARRLARRTAGLVNADELWSAGAMGLLDAARRFDPARDVRFETFAERRIRGAMLDELRRIDHLPRRLRGQLERVERVRTRLAQQLQRDATSEEIAAEVGLSIEELGAISLSAARHDGQPDEIAAPLTGADEHIERGQLAARLRVAVGSLPARLQQLLSLHYVEGLTYREIARILQVSEPRVCQLHGDALRALRSALTT